MTTEAQDGEVLIVEKCELKGAQMTLTITKGASASTAVVKSVKMADYGLPKVGFVNVVSDGQCGVVLMENPSTCNKLSSLSEVLNQVQLLFNLSKVPSDLFMDQKCTKRVGSNNFQEFMGQTLYLSPCNREDNNGKGACCPFVNVYFGKSQGCFLLENPKGVHNHESASEVLQAMFAKPVTKLDNTVLSKFEWSKAVGKSVNAS